MSKFFQTRNKTNFDRIISPESVAIYTNFMIIVVAVLFFFRFLLLYFFFVFVFLFV